MFKSNPIRRHRRRRSGGRRLFGRNPIGGFIRPVLAPFQEAIKTRGVVNLAVLAAGVAAGVYVPSWLATPFKKDAAGTPQFSTTNLLIRTGAGMGAGWLLAKSKNRHLRNLGNGMYVGAAIFGAADYVTKGKASSWLLDAIAKIPMVGTSLAPKPLLGAAVSRGDLDSLSLGGATTRADLDRLVSAAGMSGASNRADFDALRSGSLGNGVDAESMFQELG